MSNKTKEHLPVNLDAEKSVIYSMILDNRTISEVFTHLTEEDFYYTQHQILIRIIRELFGDKPVDLITIGDQLSSYLASHSSDHKKEAIKINYLTDLMDSTLASPSNILAYINVVKEKSNLRNIISTMGAIKEAAQNEPEDVNEFMDSIQQKIFALSSTRSKNDVVSMKIALKEFHDNLKEMQKMGSTLTGITTGFKKLDQYTGGLQKSDLIIIAARPAMGKTSFALNIATNAAKAGGNVLVFSLEMPVNQLVNRIISSEASINSSNLRQGRLKSNEWTKLANTMSKMVGTGIFLDDTPAISIAELASKARTLKLQEGLDLIVIDYLQLMTGSGETSRELLISNNSRALKALAKELDLPIIVLAQLNRNLESRTNKRPILSDLRESGSIEQDADQIFFIYRGEVYQDKDMEEGVAEIIIGKNRNGSIGSFLTVFQHEYTRFENRMEESYENL